MNRCTVRGRYGHRCNIRGAHLKMRGSRKMHRAYGREWEGREKRRDGSPRTTTPGWSRRGIEGTREEIRAGILGSKA